jgi:hypothetical protein
MAVWALSSLYEYAVGKLRYSSGMKVYLSNCCETDGTLKKQMRLKFKVSSSKKAPMAKRISLLVCVVLTLNLGHVMAQGVGIGTTTFSPVSDALLELRSTTSGFLMPRMTQAQRLAISSPSSGLMVYQTDGTDGFYYYDGATWMPFGLDDLGSHSATQKLVMNSYTIANSSGGDGIRITDSGNIGIGPSASTPTAKLDVIGGNVQISSSGGSAHELRFQNPAATFATAIKAGAQTANLTYTLPTVAPTADQVLTSNASGNMSWSARSEWKITGNVGTTASSAAIGATVNNNFMGTTDAKDLVFATNNLERLRIASNGNVGIGTIAPSRKFHVVGGDNSSSVDAATTNVLALLENTTNNGSAVFNIQAKTAIKHLLFSVGYQSDLQCGWSWAWCVCLVCWGERHKQADIDVRLREFPLEHCSIKCSDKQCGYRLQSTNVGQQIDHQWQLGPVQWHRYIQHHRSSGWRSYH